jgi:hypothetical protein
MLYITLMQYFLPGDVKVQHFGVVPDVPAAPEDPAGETFEAVMALRESGALDRYAREAAAESPDACRKAVGFSAGGAGLLPGMVGALQELESPLPPALLERELFRALRRALEAAEGKPLLLRPREDPVLQRGLVEMCRKLGIGPGEVEEYRFFDRRGAKQGN